MVLYSFQPSFLAPITAKTKRQTIRLPRRRHARAGEVLQLMTGPRMRPSRVGWAVCQRARDVRLDFQCNLVTLDDSIEISGSAELSAFAAQDGFSIIDGSAPAALGLTPWEYMRRFWLQTHDTDVFRGVLIDWGDTFTTAEPVAPLPERHAEALFTASLSLRLDRARGAKAWEGAAGTRVAHQSVRHLFARGYLAPADTGWRITDAGRAYLAAEAQP